MKAAEACAGSERSRRMASTSTFSSACAASIEVPGWSLTYAAEDRSPGPAPLKVSGSRTRPSDKGSRKLDGGMKPAGSTPTISTGVAAGLA